MKNKLWIIGSVIAAVIAIYFIVLTGINNSDAEIYKGQGNIIVQTEDESMELYEPYVDEEWLNADAENDKNKPIRVSINDNENALSEKDFLPTKAHFIKGEAIGIYLQGLGYFTEEVTVVPGSTKKDKNDSIFIVDVTGYPEIQLEVIYHRVTEEFRFKVIPVAEKY